MVEFSSVDDLLLVPGIGRSLIEQNRVSLVCSTPSPAPITRSVNCSTRRSLRRISHDIRQRNVESGVSVRSAETSQETPAGASGPNCVSNQTVKLCSSTVREACQLAGSGKLSATDPSGCPHRVLSKSDLRSKDEVIKGCVEDRREDECDRKEIVGVNIQEDSSDCCECCIEDDDEKDGECETQNLSVDSMPTMAKTENEEEEEEEDDEEEEEEEEEGDTVEEDIMSSDDLVNTLPVVKVAAVGDVYHCAGGRNEHHCSGGDLLAGGGGLGTDTPHEDAPPDLLDIHASLSSHRLTDEDNSSEDEEEVNDGEVEEDEDEEEVEGQMDEDGAEVDSDNCMTVDPPASPYTDKKQVSSAIYLFAIKGTYCCMLILSAWKYRFLNINIFDKVAMK